MTKRRSFKSILAVFGCLFLSVATLLTFTACGDETNGPSNRTQSPVEEYEKITTGETVYILPNSSDSKISITKENKKLQIDELIMATSLQGLVARDKAKIYIGKEDDQWVTYLKEEYNINFEVLESLDDLFSKCADSLEKKTYVKYEYDDTAVATSAINQATTIASATGSILVSSDETLENFVKDKGFTMVDNGDLTGDRPTEDAVIESYKNDLNKDIIAILDPQMKNSYAIRDYVIATSGGVFITDADTKDVMYDIYQTYNPLAMALGVSDYTSAQYKSSKGMEASVWSEEASKAGIIPVYSSSVANLSLYASLSKDVGTQKSTKDVTASDSVHYVAVLANFGYDIGYWDDASTSDKKLADKNRGEYPIGYTMNASMFELMPQAVKQAYSLMTENESFIAAPSGFGLANLNELKNHNDGKTLDKYLSRTNDIIGKADLGYVSYFGSIKDTEVLDSLAKLENVKGGFVLANNYSMPTGGIYFSNDKVFIGAREVLRDNASTKTYRSGDQIANDTAEKMAVRLSRYEKNKSKADGYTLLQVQDTATENTYAKLVEKLYKKAEDGIVFVTPDRLLELIKNNVSKDGSLEQNIYSKNEAPTAQNIEVETTEGEKVVIDLEDKIDDSNPEDAESLTVNIGARPNNGQAKVSKYKITYTPESGFTGEDTFEYTVNDGIKPVTAKVTVKVK